MCNGNSLSLVRFTVVSISLSSRGVNSSTYLAERTKNIHPKCFSCLPANYTRSDRNFCAISLLDFVAKRLCIETTELALVLVAQTLT